jgi:hypothetical protein
MIVSTSDLRLWSAKLSATFGHSVTVSDQISDQTTYSAGPPSPGFERLSIVWQLVDEIVALDPAGRGQSADASANPEGSVGSRVYRTDALRARANGRGAQEAGAGSISAQASSHGVWGGISAARPRLDSQGCRPRCGEPLYTRIKYARLGTINNRPIASAQISVRKVAAGAAAS